MKYFTFNSTSESTCTSFERNCQKPIEKALCSSALNLCQIKEYCVAIYSNYEIAFNEIYIFAKIYASAIFINTLLF